ncbi:glycosyl hydrolase family 85-domain-containing protein [Phaeosphaeria sp. MPI-PUGE-AT-0046c]|nr:glycosyl hydrolase family 85-domain-containing protein [Phaeosphaeria sp. MPI-PUGE-AT-0046c]
MATLLGWKDILRPIRDGYRHLFPAPDTGPSPEERRKWREEDRLKGFTYFDNFEQLETWNTNQADPLQRSNTPLLPRRLDTHFEDKDKSKILVCHDYAGNYHDYESVQRSNPSREMYSCEYLQYVETFVYFSHKLVCVPPPTWTNTLHRNGVKALGTILLEPQTKETEILLRHTGTGFDLANILADIAKHYGFDGFLVNLEKPFPRDSWSVDMLQSFLEQLKEALGPRRDLIWSNGLTPANIPFAKACGKILTNYCWDESQAKDSKHAALQSAFPLDHIYFGVDVWAQNKGVLSRPRSTYPKQGGGGTNTGIAVAKLAEMGMSAGVFAPAWSFEHFSRCRHSIQRVMWEGRELPKNTECSCGNALIRHQASGPPIITNAMLHPAGSESFFYTDFTRAFACSEDKEQMHHGYVMHAQLGSQSPLPNPSPVVGQDDHCSITHRLEGRVHAPARLIIESHESLPTSNDKHEKGIRWLPLYKLDMPADDSLHLVITCRNLLSSKSEAVASFYIRLSNQKQPRLLNINMTGGHDTIRTRLGTPSAPHDSARVQELGFHLVGSVGEGTVPVVETTSILIMPRVASQTPSRCSIHNIRLQTHTTDENSHTRLCWEYADNTESEVYGVPYSDLTGPFSHFDIDINGQRAGRAYALQHIVSSTILEGLAGKDMEVQVTGVGFHGQVLDRQKTTLSLRTGRDD